MYQMHLSGNTSTLLRPMFHIQRLTYSSFANISWSATFTACIFCVQQTHMYASSWLQSPWSMHSDCRHMMKQNMITRTYTYFHQFKQHVIEMCWHVCHCNVCLCFCVICCHQTQKCLSHEHQTYCQYQLFQKRDNAKYCGSICHNSTTIHWLQLAMQSNANKL